MAHSSRADVLAEWSRRHDGYDIEASWLTSTWVLGMHRIAGPVSALGIPASAVSIGGVAAATAAMRIRGRGAAVAALSTAMLDGLDGAVAARRGTASATGTRVDHGCDRVTDVLFAAALHRHGARRPFALAAAVAPLVLELYRESMRAGVAGAPGIATVGERPVRVVLVIAGLAAAPTAAATAIAGLAAAGCLQLRAARRRAQ